jgi:hypothetical protein
MIGDKKCCLQNLTAKRLLPLLRIKEILPLASGLEVGYPVARMLWFFSAPLKNFQKEVKETASGFRHILLNPSFTHTHTNAFNGRIENLSIKGVCLVHVWVFC